MIAMRLTDIRITTVWRQEFYRWPDLPPVSSRSVFSFSVKVAWSRCSPRRIFLWGLCVGTSRLGPFVGLSRWVVLLGSIYRLVPLSWSPYIVSMGLLNGCSDSSHLLIIHKYSLNQHLKKAVSTGHSGGPFSCSPAIFPSSHLIVISKSSRSLFPCIFSHLAHYIPPSNTNSTIWWLNWRRYSSYIV